MNRPDVETILKPLKSFQRRTVEHAFHRLFVAKDSTARFLVADEVGLGKTLVARGVIARTVEFLWNDVERIDVVYICSNSSIARANLPKLKIGDADQRSFALATRLTMLATQFASPDGQSGLAGNKLNFVSFTPGTSFNMGHSAGQAQERQVLFHLLLPCVPSRRTALMNLLQGWIARKDRWRWRLQNEACPIEPTIRECFVAAFREQADLQGELRTLFDTWFFRYRQSWPHEAQHRRDRAISQLRRLLADVCVHALEPDLVIVDEFQRFKSLLESRVDRQDPAAELAQKLFSAKAHDGQRVRTLLLSATPYKLYTADAEIEHEDHYEDFLDTSRFLLGDDDARVAQIKRQLSLFGTALKRAAGGGAGSGRCGSVCQGWRGRRASGDHGPGPSALLPAPLTMPWWQSAVVPPCSRLPTCANTWLPTACFAPSAIMIPCRSGSRPRISPTSCTATASTSDSTQRSISRPDAVAAVLRRYESAFLDPERLREWAKARSGQLEVARTWCTICSTRSCGGLLWMPPTVPYWPLEGPFSGKEDATKTLLFSAWNVVPDVVSAILSYEAERRMVGGRIASYENPAEQQRPLLRLTQSTAGARSRHRLLLLLLPCLPLADRAHPLAAPEGQDRRIWVRSRVEELLSDPTLPNPQDGTIDDRWEWAAPLLLDPELQGLLRMWRDGGSLPIPNPEVFSAYIDDLLAIEPDSLGRRPPNLAELLTDVALGSPAIVAARCLRSLGGLDAGLRRRLGVRIADAFWSLFNQPAVICLIRQASTGGADEGDESAYWRRVLRYCRQGNLQAVLDEHWHLLWEQGSWSEAETAGDIAELCARELIQAVQPVRSRVHARFFRLRNGSLRVPEPEEIRFRTAFALRFGHARNEETGYVSQDAVRRAFNSPFRPFVLASTSIGQEGLDFHPWCHRLAHWNLPGNPVDLEQREGRVHRYKGHAVRRNIAAAYAGAAMRLWRPGDDIWKLIFERAERAARAKGESDLVPLWIAPGRHRVQRHVPMLPYTSEVDAFARLKLQLAAYRVVFGQPRQEELLTLLGHSSFDAAQLRSWTIDLSPPADRT